MGVAFSWQKLWGATRAGAGGLSQGPSVGILRPFLPRRAQVHRVQWLCPARALLGGSLCRLGERPLLLGASCGLRCPRSPPPLPNTSQGGVLASSSAPSPPCKPLQDWPPLLRTAVRSWFPQQLIAWCRPALHGEPASWALPLSLSTVVGSRRAGDCPGRPALEAPHCFTLLLLPLMHLGGSVVLRCLWRFLLCTHWDSPAQASRGAGQLLSGEPPASRRGCLSPSLKGSPFLAHLNQPNPRRV